MSTRVEYVACDRPRVMREEIHDKGCERRRNGFPATDPDCCVSCRSLILSTKPIEYHVRDRFGQVITDWLI